jgi:hypothetical protein
MYAQFRVKLFFVIFLLIFAGGFFLNSINLWDRGQRWARTRGQRARFLRAAGSIAPTCLGLTVGSAPLKLVRIRMQADLSQLRETLRKHDATITMLMVEHPGTGARIPRRPFALVHASHEENPAMATATQTLPAVLTLEEYLQTSYGPDCDFVDDHLEERATGETLHSWLQTED